MNPILDSNKIWKIALTGGPCGGKTSALAYLEEELSQMGYAVIVIPEAATLCITNGIKPGHQVSVSAFQQAVMDTGFSLEDIFHKAAYKVDLQKYKGVILLCDRGVPDGAAYMTTSEFKLLLLNRGKRFVDVRDAGYDAVLFMTSTAIGSVENYTLENNIARTESIEQARALDRRTLKVWTGHPHVREIGNGTDFQTKLKRVLQEVCVVIGEPVPLENEQKFVVQLDWDKLKGLAAAIDIEQTYLLTSNDSHELRVRKRGQDGEYFYALTEKRDHGPGKRLEIERIISESDYNCYMRMKDPSRGTVRKTRYCLFYEEQYLEIDRYLNYGMDESGLGILEIELTRDDQEVKLPNWIENSRNVTDVREYKNSEIARFIAMMQNSPATVQSKCLSLLP